MFIKKLFLFTSITLLATATVLPDDVQPEQQQSTAQYIKDNFTTIMLYITMRLHSTFNYGIDYLNYIKSFFWPKPTSTDSSLIIPPNLAQKATSQENTKNPIPAQPRDAENALARVAQDLAIIKSSIALTKEGAPKLQSASKAPSLIEAIKNKTKGKQATKTEPIEEINSPAIEKEKAEVVRKQLTQLVQHVKELDTIIAQLPPTEWQMWQEKQTKLLEPATPALKNAIQQSIQSSWREHGTAILTLAIQATGMGMTGALSAFATQYTKIATGNRAALDTDALLISFLTYASAHLISASNKLLTTNTAIQSTVSAAETNILYQAILAPSVHNKTYQFKMPLFRGVIDYLIMNEAYALLSTMLEQNGEITQTIKNINMKQILFGKKTSSPSNLFVTLALPKVKTAISNKQLALALTEVGWIFFQSATLGGLFWAAGLGYAETSMAESISYAVLTGMAQGVVANVAALTNATTPGAILSISSIPLSQQLVAMTGVNITTTPQAVITGVLQAIGTEVTNFLIDESDKAGGLWETLQKGKAALGSAISSRWSGAWSNITDAWATIQEIEPLPL
jgi:hypothetical protein